MSDAHDIWWESKTGYTPPKENEMNWEESSNAIDDRIRVACVAEGHEDFHVIYSAYDTYRPHNDAEGIPVDNLDEVAAYGTFRIFCPYDEYWDSTEGKSGKEYVSARVYTNPTWLDVAICANESIATTGDKHHVFLESVEEEGGLLRMWFGS